MNCDECISHQDDYLDNQLSHDIHEAMTRHIAACPDCQKMMRKNRELLQGLRNLDAPPPSPGFLKLAMANAVRIDRQQRRRKWFMQFAAVAAMVCLVVLGSLKLSPLATHDTPQSTGIRLSLHESKEMVLLVQAAENLHGATISIDLPPQLMLASNPGLRHFSWQADVKEGKNLIPLPLVATAPGKVTVTARIEHDRQTKIMRVQVEILPTTQTG